MAEEKKIVRRSPRSFLSQLSREVVGWIEAQYAINRDQLSIPVKLRNWAWKWESGAGGDDIHDLGNIISGFMGRGLSRDQGYDLDSWITEFKRSGGVICEEHYDECVLELLQSKLREKLDMLNKEKEFYSLHTASSQELQDIAKTAIVQTNLVAHNDDELKRMLETIVYTNPLYAELRSRVYINKTIEKYVIPEINRAKDTIARAIREEQHITGAKLSDAINLSNEEEDLTDWDE